MKRIWGNDILMGFVYALILPFLFLALWVYGIPVKGLITGLIILCVISCVVGSLLLSKRNESIYSKLEERFNRID